MKKTKLLVGTRKGAWTVEGSANGGWQINGPQHLGAMVFHYVSDHRDPNLLMMAVGSGHLGPSVYVSKDGGANWKESSKPPQFAQVENGRSVDHVFWLTPGHSSQPKVWYAGTSPQGLFKTVDAGETWEEVKGLNNHPDFFQWRGGDKDGTPDGPKLHSVIVDKNDAKHLLIGMSSGGIFESFDEGASWKALNSGVAMDFYPPKEDGSEYEFGHDPHCVAMHPQDSNILYHQNHCGIYRMDRTQSDRWQRIGNNMPKDVGDIGFPIVVHPRDVNTAWVFPMDGSGQWPRTSPGGKPAVYCTRDGGNTWQRQDNGFPKHQAWWTVKRQCMTADNNDPVGIYVGTTNGQVWASFDEGKSWQGIAMDLPQIYSVRIAH